LQDDFLLNTQTKDSLHPTWARGSFYDALLEPELWVRLPSFRDFVDFDAYLMHPANYVFVLLGILLIVSGWLWQRGVTYLVGMIWAVFLVVGIGTIALISPVIEPFSVAMNEFDGQTGTVSYEARVATEDESEEGLLARGPLIPLPVAGAYEVTLEYDSRNVSYGPVAIWDILLSSERRPVARTTLPPSTINGGIVSYRASFDEDAALTSRELRFRVVYLGNGDLAVERLTITPLYLASE
jgi:hypothetical protein